MKTEVEDVLGSIILQVESRVTIAQKELQLERVKHDLEEQIRSKEDRISSLKKVLRGDKLRAKSLHSNNNGLNIISAAAQQLLQIGGSSQNANSSFSSHALSTNNNINNISSINNNNNNNSFSFNQIPVLGAASAVTAATAGIGLINSHSNNNNSNNNHNSSCLTTTTTNTTQTNDMDTSQKIISLRQHLQEMTKKQRKLHDCIRRWVVNFERERGRKILPEEKQPIMHYIMQLKSYQKKIEETNK